MSTTITTKCATRREFSSAAVADARVERVIPVLIFLACLGYLWIFRHFTTMEPDEGIVLQGATRVLDGQVPYRDFFSFYTPGSFYLVAGLFRVFGNSLGVARTSIAVVGAACSVVTYALARRVCPRHISLLAALLATIVGTAFRFLVLHNYYSTVFACLTVYAAVRFVEGRNSAWAFATGSFVALTFLFEQPKGGGLALGLLAGFVLLREHLPLRRPIAALAVGVLWPFLLTFTYFASQHAAVTMIASWLWPLHHYTAANHVPYGWQNWSDEKRVLIFGTGSMVIRLVKAIVVSPGFVVPMLPLIAVGVLVYWAGRARRRADDRRCPYYVILCSAITGLLLSVVIARADILHFIYLAPLFYVVLAWAVGAEVKSKLLLQIRPALVLYVLTAFGLLGFAVLLSATGAHNRIDTRRGIVVTRDTDTVLPYLQAHTNAGDRVLVYPYLPLYNYLTATQSPTRYEFFQPGMNTDEQAREIVAALSSGKASAVLFEPAFAQKIGESWPETPISSIVNDPVSDYLAQNFRVCKVLQSPEHWQLEYMVRRGSICP